MKLPDAPVPEEGFFVELTRRNKEPAHDLTKYHLSRRPERHLYRTVL